MLFSRYVIALALSIGMLHLAAHEGGAQQTLPGDPASAESLSFAAGRTAAEGVSVTEFAALSAIPAVPLGFAGSVALFAPNPRSGFSKVAIASLGISALTFAFATFSNANPAAPPEMSFDGVLSREAFDSAYRERLRERRMSASTRATLLGAAAGVGAALIFAAILPAT